jgi:hypothetical protein
MVFEQPYGDALDDLGFVGKIKMCEHHAASLEPRPEKVQSFFIRSFARRNPPHSDESAVQAWVCDR